METKVCSVCKVEKGLTAFYPKMGRCKDCHKTKTKTWAKAHPEVVKKIRDKWRAKPDSKLKERVAARRWQKEHPKEFKLIRFKQNLKQYGLTLEQYEEMEKNQSGLCAICGIAPSRKLDVDHNHITSKVRALLCSNCNTAVGLLKEDPKLFAIATEYLLTHSQN